MKMMVVMAGMVIMKVILTVGAGGDGRGDG